MSDLGNILKEEYIKKERTIAPQTLMEMVEEVIGLMPQGIDTPTQ